MRIFLFNDLHAKLCKSFQMTDEEPLCYQLGMETYCSNSSVRRSRKSYINSILWETRLSTCHPTSKPINKSLPLHDDNGSPQLNATEHALPLSYIGWKSWVFSCHDTPRYLLRGWCIISLSTFSNSKSPNCPSTT